MSEMGTEKRRLSPRDGLMIASGALLALLTAYLWGASGRGDEAFDEAADKPPAAGRGAASDEVRVSHDVAATTGVESVLVSIGPAHERLQTAGVVEPDPRQVQEVTPLIAGRVEQVSVTLGDPVQEGATLLTISSPQIAELQGTLKSAQARLVQTEGAFNRTTRLVDLGAGAGRDLFAAEAEFEAAKAQVTQAQQSLSTLGATPAASSSAKAATDMVEIRAPISGRVIARTVNAGAWIEAGKSLLTIANLNTVWVIASVPEARLALIPVGAPVEIRAPVWGGSPRPGRVGYVDPQLDQETRTARVRVELGNQDQALKVGMFVDVALQGTPTRGASELTIPSLAVQRIGGRTVVFLPTNDAERFEVRDIELGEEVGDGQIVRSGLTAGDRVVTKGAFTLKSQLLKGRFGEDEEIGTRTK